MRSICGAAALFLLLFFFTTSIGLCRSDRDPPTPWQGHDPPSSVVINPRDGSTSTYVRDGSGTGSGTLIDHRTGQTSTAIPGGTVIPHQGGPPGQMTPGGTVEWPDR